EQAVGHPVGGHGTRARAHHGGRDPDHRPRSRPASGRDEHGDEGKRQGEHRVLEFDGLQDVADRAQSPSSFPRRGPPSRHSSVLAISRGHGWVISSSGPFSVASTPSLPPKRWRRAAWSRSSIGPSTITRSRRGSMLPVARQATSDRSWTLTCSLTTTIFFATIINPRPHTQCMSLRACPAY